MVGTRGLGGLAAALILCGAGCSPAPERPPPSEPGQPPAIEPAAEVRDIVPAAFRGEWRLDVKDCGSATDDSRLRLGERDIQAYESQGAVGAVRTETPREIVIETEVTGEGERWRSTQRFRLSADGTELTELDAGGAAGLTRRRCP